MNEVLYDNIHARMGSDDFVTATVLRFYPGGQVVYAGAHEDLVVLRARTGVCEQIETQGSVPAFASDLEVARKDDGEAPVVEGGTEEDSPGKPKLSPRDRRRMEREAAKKAGEEA